MVELILVNNYLRKGRAKEQTLQNSLKESHLFSTSQAIDEVEGKQNHHHKHNEIGQESELFDDPPSQEREQRR